MRRQDMSKELIIFKKNTDAPGTNRGFVYQYLKTLIQWLNNYQSGEDNLLYCEVEDDMKQINRAKSSIQWTQVKCYSSVFNLGHPDIIKSLYNFFALFISYKSYETSFTFETNSKVSSKDVLLNEWIVKQTLMDFDRVLLAKLVVEFQKMLKETSFEAKCSIMKSVADKINTLETKKSSATKNKNKQAINDLKNELQNIEELGKELELNISDIETVSEFINAIKWKFDDVTSDDSIEKLKGEAIQLLKQISPRQISTELYFNRLISEIFFKSIEVEIKDRCLDNDLLTEILSETEAQIKENTDQVIMNKFNGIEEMMELGFSGVNVKLDKLVNNIDFINELAATNAYVPLINLPIIEKEEVGKILEAESEKQSKLEMKIRMIKISDPEQQEHLISIATELRCRYLLFLQKLKLENLYTQYDALKSLEGKVKRYCTDSVIDNDEDETEMFNPRKFWKTFREELLLMLKDLKIRNKVDIDEDVVFAQMYQMAAECHLRWHKKDGIYE